MLKVLPLLRNGVADDQMENQLKLTAPSTLLKNKNNNSDRLKPLP